MAANLVIPLREEKQLVEAITNTPCMWRRALSAATREVEDEDSWEVRAFAEDAGGLMGGTWPPRSYSCTFCRREFRSAQALGGHMNVHRRDRARLRQSSPGGIPPETAASFPSPVMVPGVQDQFPAGLCFLYPLPTGNSNSDNTLLYPVAHHPCNSMTNNTSVVSPPPQMFNPAGCTVNSDQHHSPQLQTSFPYPNYNSNLTAFIPSPHSSSPHNSSPSAHQPSTVLSISPYSPSDALPSVHLPAANIHRSNSSDSAEISDVLAGSSSGGLLSKGEGALVKWSHAGAFQPYSPVSSSFKDQNGSHDHVAAYRENQKKMRLDHTVEEYSEDDEDEDDGDDDDDDLDLELRLGQRAT